MNEPDGQLLPGGVHYKVKSMPNGEVRTSVRTPDGVKFTITEASDWTPATTELFPWQEAHFHKGLWESYQLISGWMRMIWIDGGICHTVLRESSQTRVLSAGMPHIVLLGPQAKIITTSFGEAVPNSDRGENDWWPAPSDFHLRVSDERGVVERLVRQAA